MSGQLTGAITLILLLAFVGGWVWAWSSKRRATFSAAAQLPLEEDSEHDSADSEVSR
jgi:cytochrome c oxidase cbb3-type subunit 4